MPDKQRSSNKFFALGRVLLFYVVSIVVFAAMSGLFKSATNTDHLNIFVCCLLTLALVASFARWEKLSLKEIGLVPGNKSVLRFLSGAVIGIMMVLIQVVALTAFAEVKFTFAPDYKLVNVISSIALYLLLALREELVFRSYALRSLANTMRPVVALAIITALFILEHKIAGTSWKIAFLGSGLGGILFCVAALKTRGLALPLGLHFAWNFTQAMLGFKNDPGLWREVVTSGYEVQAENIALAGFAISMCTAIIGILLFYRKIPG